MLYGRLYDTRLVVYAFHSVASRLNKAHVLVINHDVFIESLP